MHLWGLFAQHLVHQALISSIEGGTVITRIFFVCALGAVCEVGIPFPRTATIVGACLGSIGILSGFLFSYSCLAPLLLVFFVSFIFRCSH